jgi:hypothetical protein
MEALLGFLKFIDGLIVYAENGLVWAWNVMGTTILAFIGGMSSLVVVGFIFFFNYPHKCEKAFALIWKFCDRLRIFASFAHKNYVKHDLQGRINDFIDRHTKDTPGLSAKKIQLEWIDPNTTKEAFLSENIVIIRVKRDEDEARTFARSAYLFVSTALLYKAKRYLSPSQALATDLFASMKLLKEEKPEIVDAFLEEHLHPKVDEPESKINRYFDTFQVIANAGLFFPIYLQELHFLGQKVFGDRKDSQINIEVDSLITHLEKIAQRKIGDTSVPLEFQQTYCKFSVVLVGLAPKLEKSVDPYVRFIQEHSVPSKIETLYLIGDIRNRDKIMQIAKVVSHQFHIVRSYQFKNYLTKGEIREKRTTYLQVLRNKEVEIFHSSKEEGI